MSSLVLLAPAGFGRVAMAEAMTAPGISAVAKAALPWVLRRRGTVAESWDALMTASRQATLALVAAGRATTSHPTGPAAYSGPVAAVWGTKDRVVRPSHGRAVAAVFPQADIVLWDGGHHSLVRERGGQVAELVARGRTSQPERRRKPCRNRRLVLWPFPRINFAPRFA